MMIAHDFPLMRSYPGGSLKAEGLGDGGRLDHRQASPRRRRVSGLDDATRTGKVTGHIMRKGVV
jgi:hypothetical protein